MCYISSSSPLQLLYDNFCAYIFYFRVTTMGWISAALSGRDIFPTPPAPTPRRMRFSKSVIRLQRGKHNRIFT